MIYETRAEWYIGCVKEKGMLGMSVTFPVTYSMKFENGVRRKLKDCINVYEMKDFKEAVEENKIYNMGKSGIKIQPLWGINYPVYNMESWHKVSIKGGDKKVIVLGIEHDRYLILDMETEYGTRVCKADELKELNSTFDGRERHLISENELIMKQRTVNKLKYILDPEIWDIKLGDECTGALIEGTVLFNNYNLHLGKELRIPDKIEYLKGIRLHPECKYDRIVGGKDIIKVDEFTTRNNVDLSSVELEGPINSTIRILHSGDSELGGLYNLSFPNAVNIKELEIIGIPSLNLKIGKNTIISDYISIKEGSYTGKVNIERI